MGTSWPLLAETTSRTSYELARLQSYSERWHFLVLGLACALVVAFVAFMYRRDSVELRPGVGWLLAGLRIVALVGLLAYYLQLEKRTERSVTHNSRVLVLVDTSLSMGLHDADSTAVPAKPNRLEQVTAVLDEGQLLSQLREKHDVVLVRFDSETNRVITLAKLPIQAHAWRRCRRRGGNPTAENPRGEPLGQAQRPRKRQCPLEERASAPRDRNAAGTGTFGSDQRRARQPGGRHRGLQRRRTECRRRSGRGHRSRPRGQDPDLYRGHRIGSPPRQCSRQRSGGSSRAYPGDSFTVTGYIQSQELAGRTVSVELSSRPAGEGATEQAKVEGTENIVLGDRHDVIPVKFEISPTEKGRARSASRSKPRPEDSNANDDEQEADVEIVDRKTKVLLVASGPTREYIFLRNQLRRDKQIIVDVWLQSAPPGISQDANQILESFPSSVEELFEYDCIVAFDPDWTALDVEQVDMLERWVAEKAGGLIAIAGPVETDRWVRDAKMAKIRALYPVEFNRRASLLDDGRYGSDTPWPIDFTREGIEAEFLWLSESGPQPADLVRVSGRVWLLCGARTQAGGNGLRPLFRSPGGRRRTAAGVHGRPVLWGRTGLLPGQRRNVAPAGAGRQLLRTVLHQARAPRLAGPTADWLAPRHAPGRSRSLLCWAIPWQSGRN